ncbi:RagB/SusD family nutrient uptake outer membrane protein [Duncaniella muris]|jgi:hypothetical protein|uniref:RagB/SusD family nutrient uptake outer membrane protein n=1 Tax=Duncaniella muris TaxID=2094150 RepID=UPI0025B0ECA5|nr:RagB/SusD family nutrient uptake outer membrane protein [Duncaniella muris]
MKTINKVKSILAASLLAVSVTSCADWLEVKMEDKVMENTLFSDYRGYMTALNGVYLSMNDVYSRNLMTGPIDVMAQYYNVTENKNHSLKLYATYAYSDVELEKTFSTIWANMYTLLANLNVVIEHTAGSNPLTESQLGIIRGESLALRAFFHFDLLRLFGPIYTENPTMRTIPYQNSSSREIQPLLPANEVMEKILADLAEAETLLSQYDPVITDGVRNEVTEDNGVYAYDYSFRQLRMNYYAVKLLQARAYLWMGDKATAYRIATEEILDKVTTDKLVIFPWATKEQVEAAGKPDCLFSTEVIFSLYNTKRSEIQSLYFSSALRALSSRLTFFGNSLTGDESKVGTFYDDDNDLRVKMWKLVEPLQSEIEEAESNGEEAKSTLALTKYESFTKDAVLDGSETYRYMMPLMRLSEVYLIAAECTNDRSEAFRLINTIRHHRLCEEADENSTDLAKLLTYEMAREVIGEGQLFFFYKRRGEEQIISGTSADGTTSMIKTNYVVPIPQEELDERATETNK